MIAIDTNALIYASDISSPFHAACHSWLERQRSRADAWYSTWPIAYQFLRATTHPRVMRQPLSAQTAWGFVASALFSAPGFGVLMATRQHGNTATRQHGAVAEEVLAEMPQLAGNLMHDAHTAILMREHGIRRICTRDTDFHHFDFLEVADPVRI